MADRTDNYALNLDEAHAFPWAYTSFDTKLGGWLIPYSLIEPHDHVRDPIAQGEMFDLVVPETAKLYDWSISMPNLAKNRILTPAQALEFEATITKRGKLHNPNFKTSVPFYIEEGLPYVKRWREDLGNKMEIRHD